MLEIPESTNLARQLKETVLGKRITHVQAAQSPHGFAFYFGDPARYPDMLVGKTVTDAYALAGFVQVEAGEMRLIFHDGTNIRYLAPEAARPKKHQLYIEFEEGDALCCTVQMYGAMMAFPEGAYENPYYEAAKSKPHPLSDGFHEAYFEGIVQEGGGTLSAKALLATQQRVPGLGNGVLQDILWNAKVHPQSKVGALRDGDMEALFRSVKDTLREMTQEGGRDTEKNLFGQKGGYFTVLSSKTLAHPCRRCGGGLVRKAYLGGNIYACPQCQPLLK